MIIRRGASLAELLATIVCCSVILGLSSALMQAVIRSERLGTTHLIQTTTLDSISRQFRQDVRAAKGFDITDVADQQGGRLKMTLSAGQTVEYLLDSSSVIRSEWAGDKAVSRETFLMPIENNSQVHVEQREGLPLLKLVLVFSAGKASRNVLREFRVEAIQGKDDRFAVSEDH